jgi:hypothetical protein
VDGKIVIGHFTTQIVYVRLQENPNWSVTVTVNVEQPTVVGVPEIVQPVGDNPAGSAPVTLHVYGPVPPLPVIVWLYALPSIASGRTGAGRSIRGRPSRSP